MGPLFASTRSRRRLAEKRSLNPSSLQSLRSVGRFPGDDVEAAGQMAPLRMVIEKISCAPSNSTLLCPVHRGCCAAIATVASRADFYKQEPVFIKGDEVNFADFAAKLPVQDFKAVGFQYRRAARLKVISI